jgi:hypothetical protein
MSQWGVVEFVSRVAERMSTASEDLAAQLARHRPATPDDLATVSLEALFPPVEPSPAFVEALRRQLLEAPPMVPAEMAEAPTSTTRRVVYGIAALGSLASAAVIAVVVYRARFAAQRPAA